MDREAYVEEALSERHLGNPLLYARVYGDMEDILLGLVAEVKGFIVLNLEGLGLNPCGLGTLTSEIGFVLFIAEGAQAGH